MDERIVKILKSIATEKTYDGSMGDTYCAFCGGDRDYDDQFDVIAHEATCETREARRVLKEQGMPLYGYKVTLEVPEVFTKDHWVTSTYYVEGFSEQEISERFPENKDHEQTYPKRRNVQIERVREM